MTAKTVREIICGFCDARRMGCASEDCQGYKKFIEDIRAAMPSVEEIEETIRAHELIAIMRQDAADFAEETATAIRELMISKLQ